jgi:hypothetical protein
VAWKQDWFLPVEAGYGDYAASQLAKRPPRCRRRIGSKRSQIIDFGAPKGNRTHDFAVKGA